MFTTTTTDNKNAKQPIKEASETRKNFFSSFFYVSWHFLLYLYHRQYRHLNGSIQIIECKR
jgi:hypothetical protein